MRQSMWMFTATLAGLLLAAAAPSRAEDGEGLVAHPDPTPWARWQGRVSYGSRAPVWRSGLGGFESGGLSVVRPGNVDGIGLMGDYYFAHSFDALSGGGFRATSGLIIGRRPQRAMAQPGSMAGGLVSVGGRVFGQPPSTPNGDTTSETAALPYLGLGYTGLAARGSLSFSADLGMVGQGGDPATRPFGAGPRSVEAPGRDPRLMPMMQLGVLYSF